MSALIIQFPRPKAAPVAIPLPDVARAMSDGAARDLLGAAEFLRRDEALMQATALADLFTGGDDS